VSPVIPGAVEGDIGERVQEPGGTRAAVLME
jgi:hypothetical protein